MLECATAEAVLRLDKTILCDEAEEIQSIYLREQNHENLLQYLEATLPQESAPQLLQVRVETATLNAEKKFKVFLNTNFSKHFYSCT